MNGVAQVFASSRREDGDQSNLCTDSPTSLSCLRNSEALIEQPHREGRPLYVSFATSATKLRNVCVFYCSPEPERCLRSSLIGVAALLCHMGTKSSFDLSISSLDIALTGNGDEIGLNN